MENDLSKDKNYPGATEGEAVIYQMRGKNFEKWNEWRSFRPVVLFYGEMLANSGDIAGLERFLGEEGLLRNDDIFGEGFFMGLEILYKLSEKLREEERMKKMLGKYEEIIGNWSIHDAIRKAV